MPLFPSSGALLAGRIAPVAEQCVASLQVKTVFDFGPVFLSDITNAETRRPPLSSHAERCENSLALSCFGLTMLASEEFSATLDAMHKRSGFALFADFKVAERNLEIPACLLMGGFRRFCRTENKSFTASGGLEGLLYAERSRFRILERHTLLGGSLLCVLAKCLPARP